jgi:FMN phosphatase YigB (HAD superfamily)
MVKGVCVFDLDGTLYNYRCGDSRDECTQELRAAIHACYNEGFAIAINTARFRIKSRIKNHLRHLGLDVDLLPPGAVQLRAYTPRRKARAMYRIASLFNVHPSQVVLYDNLQRNVHAVLANGFQGVNVVHEGFVRPSQLVHLTQSW